MQCIYDYTWEISSTCIWKFVENFLFENQRNILKQLERIKVENETADEHFQKSL